MGSRASMSWVCALVSRCVAVQATCESRRVCARGVGVVWVLLCASGSCLGAWGVCPCVSMGHMCTDTGGLGLAFGSGRRRLRVRGLGHLLVVVARCRL